MIHTRGHDAYSIHRRMLCFVSGATAYAPVWHRVAKACVCVNGGFARGCPPAACVPPRYAIVDGRACLHTAVTPGPSVVWTEAFEPTSSLDLV